MMQPLRESTPLWVWITVGLMALGTLAYLGAALLAEYLMPIGELGLREGEIGWRPKCGMLTGVSVSSQTIPAARIYFCILARCNQRASIRTISEKVTG